MKDLYTLKTEFLEHWPLSRLKNMSLEEYTNLDETSFCDWVDKKTRDLGNITGGSKFGIYVLSNLKDNTLRNDRKNDGKYVWRTKYGNDRDVAFATVKSLIVQIAASAIKNEMQSIITLDLGNAYKWKIAFLYSDYTILNIFKQEAIAYIAKEIDIENIKNKTYLELHQSILGKKPEDQDFYTYTNKLLSKYSLKDYGWIKPIDSTNMRKVFKTSKNQTIQQEYDEFEKNSGVQKDSWYLELKKYSEVLKKLIQNINDDVYESYEELNIDFKRKCSDDTDDFLERYLFKSNNGFSTIRNQLITHQQRQKIWNDTNIDPELLFDLLKENDPHKAHEKCHSLIGENKWTVIHRFIRAMFPDAFTAIDSLSHFKELEKTLNTKFQFQFKEKNHVNKNQEAVNLINTEDKYAKQIFFWELIRSKNNVNSQNVIFMESHPLNQILYGPPGTGKTYKTKQIAVSIANPDFEVDDHLLIVDQRKLINKEYQRLYDSGQIVFTTFHQSFSYEDFVEGIKPDTVDGKIAYDIIPGVFKDLCEKADIKSDSNFESVLDDFKKDLINTNGKIINTGTIEFEVLYRGGKTFNINPKDSKNENPLYPASIENILKLYKNIPDERMYNPSYVKGILNHLYEEYKLAPYNSLKNKETKNYVLILDEINRGNVSAIFGELITLLEEDKRFGAPEALSVKLPYSKTEFAIPKNLYIIGTMNTADRSVEALDTALRRRFEFTETLPDPFLLQEITFGEISLQEVLELINNRIEALLDRDHTIGHAYFLSIANNDIEKLTTVFNNKIIPLLQEYFYNDYEKIALVLGEGFIRRKEVKDIKFAFKGIEKPEIPVRYELITEISNMNDALQKLIYPNA